MSRFQSSILQRWWDEEEESDVDDLFAVGAVLTGLKRHRQDDEYMEMWSRFVKMKAEEAKQKYTKWKAITRIEERKLDIEERKLDIEKRRLMWEKEQKIMSCDFSSLDESQKAYVQALRTEIARAKAASLNSRASENGSGADGDNFSSACRN